MIDKTDGLGPAVKAIVVVYPGQIPDEQVSFILNNDYENPIEAQPDKTTLAVHPDTHVTIETKNPTTVIVITPTTEITPEEIIVVDDKKAKVRLMTLIFDKIHNFHNLSSVTIKCYEMQNKYVVLNIFFYFSHAYFLCFL